QPVSPAILEADKVFRDELPELLKTHLHQWVAYRGSRRLGFHTSQHALYQECLERGLAPGEFVVEYIHRPLHPDALVVGPGIFSDLAVPLILDDLPFADNPYDLALPGGGTIRIGSLQIVFWAAVTRRGMTGLPSHAPRIPLVFDSGFNGAFI